MSMFFIRRALLVLLMVVVWPGAGWAQRFVPRLPPIRPPAPGPRFIPVPHVVPVHPSAGGAGGQADGSSWIWWVLGGVLAVGGIGWLTVWATRRKTSAIRITGTPPGEAPEHVRSAWIGLELPLSPGETGLRTTEQVEVLSLRKTGAMSGYVVDGNKAVELLAARSPEAAEWWRQNCAAFLKANGCLIFPPDVCERL
jgi:hypothetical protein